MNRDSVLALALAVCCIGAAGVSATTLDSTLSQEPDDVVDLDFSKLPIGQDQGERAEGALEEGNQQSRAPKEDSEGSSDMEQRDSGAQQNDQSSSTDEEREGESGPAGSSDQQGDSGSSDQRSGQESGAGRGTGAGGEERLLDRLLDLLMQLLPLLVLLVLAALAYRYRRHLLALGLAVAGVVGDREVGSSATGSSWPSQSPSNEVHRAWLSMVSETGLDDPSRRTPSECAAAAIDAGFDPAAVEALTETFEEVRYGGKPVTDERRERARQGLDRLGRGGTA